VALGTLIESLSVEVDDNLSVPLTVGLALWIMYHYFLPGLNVYTFG
jgi:dolichol kinase